MMRPGIFRIVALLLVVLGASPFTAPFYTCDMMVLNGVSSSHDQDDRHDRSQPSNDHGRHGAVIKTAGSLAHAPILAATVASAAPAPGGEARLIAGRVASVSSRPVPVQVLRI